MWALRRLRGHSSPGKGFGELTVDLLEFRGITRRFGSVTACDGVCLTVQRGEIHGLIGQNGAGKSTLMKILFGMLEPDDGQIMWKGKATCFSSPHEAVSQGIGMVQQNLCLAEGMSILENVIANHEPHVWGILRRSEAERRLQELMRRFSVDLPLHRPVREAGLGVAQLQLIEILRLLWREIELLILDEPTSSLGPVEIEALFNVLTGLREEGVTVIIISHRLSEILAVADRITVMREGKVMGTVDRGEATEQVLSKMMFGFSFEGERRLKPCRDVPVLEANRLCGRIIDSFSLSLREGEVLGVAALPQNGGEELARILGGTAAPLSGSITIGDHDVSRASPRQRVDVGLAYVPEDSINEGTVAQFSVAENFALGRTSSFSVRRVGVSVVRWNDVYRSAGALRQSFGVKYDHLKQRVAALSGGNIQRLIVARAIASEPSVLVMMHPTKSLDVDGARQVIDWIHGRIADPDNRLRGAIIISPDLEELLGNCHRIMILYRGKCVGEFNGERPTQGEVAEMGSLLTGKSIEGTEEGEARKEDA